MLKNDEAPKLQTFGLYPQLPFEFPNLPKFKVVNYFGLPVAVPKGYKWLAMDTNGDLYAYKHKPYLDCGNYHVKDEHDSDDHACLQVNDLLSFIDEVTFEQVKKSRIKVKKLPRFYP